jgi:hypothetical protein
MRQTDVPEVARIAQIKPEIALAESDRVMASGTYLDCVPAYASADVWSGAPCALQPGACTGGKPASGGTTNGPAGTIFQDPIDI